MNANSPIQFRPGEVGEALDQLSDLRREGINKSEIAREGMKQVIQEVTTPEEKAMVYARFQEGEISEDVARVFLGDDLDTMQADAEAVHVAIEDDTSDLVE